MRKTFMVDQVSVKEKIQGFKYEARYPVELTVLLVALLSVIFRMILK